jgi:hypothetical protein
MRRVALRIVNGLSKVGAETVAAALALGLSARWEPHVLCLREGEGAGESILSDGLRDAGVPLHRIGMGGLRDARSALALVALLRRLRPAVVHAHNRPSDGWAMMGAAAAGVPARLYTRHLTYTDLTPAMRRRYRLSARLAHRVVAVSGAVAGHLIREEKTPLEKIAIVPNGVDAARSYRYATRDRAGARASGVPGRILGDAVAPGEPEGADIFLAAAARIPPPEVAGLRDRGEERGFLETCAPSASGDRSSSPASRTPLPRSRPSISSSRRPATRGFRSRCWRPWRRDAP